MKPRVLAVGGLAVLLLVSAVWLGLRYARGRAGGSPQVTVQLLKAPSPVTTVTMRTIEGQTISSADWRGRVTIVNFWATWCPPCRAEIPDLVALQDKYRGKVQIIGVSEDDDPPEAVARFAKQYGVNYPIVMSTPEIRKAFTGVSALPTSFVIDRDLRVVQRHIGMLHADVTEEETRILAGLSSSAKIEYVEDVNRQLIKDAALATDIPGIDLKALPAAKKTAVLQKLNSENCTCGCGLTLAACRINDPSCDVSLPIARKIVDDAAATP